MKNAITSIETDTKGRTTLFTKDARWYHLTPADMALLVDHILDMHRLTLTPQKPHLHTHRTHQRKK